MNSFFNFKIIYIFTIYYDMSSEIIHSVAYENHDDF
jgi:hypothetical protein